jgi:methylenetetrahydrofolate dehydrogenase (NADP+)/methenyltetrahydrofolate cyclohydrolase
MAEARIIDGKGFAQALVARIAGQVAALADRHGITPGLAAVMVGDDPASRIYVRNKERRLAEAGMKSYGRTLSSDIAQPELMAEVAALNGDAAVHGILLQLPLPGDLDAAAAIDAIDPAKDVDGFHPVNAGLLAGGRPAMIPCTPLGCRMLLEDLLGDLAGLRAVILGRSNIVGKPMAQLLLAAHCTVTIAHSRTRDLAPLCRAADILVVAMGRAEMVRGDWIKPGATVIDVGINRLPAADGKTRLVGDVAFDEAVRVAGAITPVPGGVGPMTIACLLQNTLLAACRQNGVPVPAAPN